MAPTPTIPETARAAAPSQGDRARAASASAPPPLSPTPSRSRYLENLAALYAVDPDLAGRIDASPFASCVGLQVTRSGALTASRADDAGRPVLLHSRYDPAAEATSLITVQTEAHEKRRRSRKDDERKPEGGVASVEDSSRDDTPLANEVFVLLGLGLGYQIEALRARFREPVIIAVEPDLAALKTAMCLWDMAEDVRRRRITLIADADKAIVHDRLRPLLTNLLLGTTLLTMPHTNRLSPAHYAAFTDLLRDFISYSRLQMHTLLRNARITVQNVAFNLPSYIRGPGVEVLENKAAGYPAILVSAGPSLARVIDQLAELRGRAVIIAVQTVLKTLLARGIRPHFVTSLDYHAISAQFFQSIPDLGDVALVAEPKATWHVLDAFPGRTHVLASGIASELLREHAPRRGALPAGSTVAHLSYYLAEYLGCNPIMFVGQDLSFSEGLYYPAGTPIERLWEPELSRFGTLEMKQWERVARQRGGMRKVKDIHGRDVYTDESMFAYAEQFQADFIVSQRRIILASEGGMALTGATQQPLREAAAEFCTRELPEALFKVPSDYETTPVEQAVGALRSRLDEVRAVREVAAETEPLLARLETLIDAPTAFNKLVPRVDELRARMSRHPRTYDMVVQVSQLGELQRLQADRAIRDDGDETSQSARRRLRRDRAYVTALLDGCDFLLEMLPQAITRLEATA